MPPRKPDRAKAPKHELEAFAEKYDTLVLLYGDPVEMVFRVMAAAEDDDTKLRAADMLMSYRYPRVKAAELTSASTGPMMQLTINAVAPTPLKTLERVPTLKLIDSHEPTGG